MAIASKLKMESKSLPSESSRIIKLLLSVAHILTLVSPIFYNSWNHFKSQLISTTLLLSIGADGKRYRVRYTADEFGYHPVTEEDTEPDE